MGFRPRSVISFLSAAALLARSASVAALAPAAPLSRSSGSPFALVHPSWSRDGGIGARNNSRRGRIKSPLNAQSILPDDDGDHDGDLASAVVRRRDILAGLSLSSAAAILASSESADAIDNPLNLKGTFWETGQLYQKSDDPLPDDDGDFFVVLDNTVEALHSPTLLEAISEGKYGQASRLLRGGLVSESKIRIAANALIDSIPEEDDGAIYKSNESFRVFLRYLDVLDAEVENASRPAALGGGGEGDPRMRILTRLGEAEDAMKAFLKNVRAGLGE